MRPSQYEALKPLFPRAIPEKCEELLGPAWREMCIREGQEPRLPNHQGQPCRVFTGAEREKQVTELARLRTVTALDVAGALKISQKTANNILTRMERAGALVSHKQSYTKHYEVA